MASSRLKRKDEPEAPSSTATDPGFRVPKASARDIVQLASQAGEILSRAREAALAPGIKKTLRKFNLKEVAELLGLSPKTLVRAAQRQEIPSGERVRGNRLLFTLEEIHEIQARLGLRPWRDPATDRPITVAVANFKGGVGKTSTSIHLGQHFALRGYRTLMIDLDAQASLTTLFSRAILKASTRRFSRPIGMASTSSPRISRSMGRNLRSRIGRRRSPTFASIRR
jgi:predicted DNA-binding transcriptional regulator AlpA